MSSMFNQMDNETIKNLMKAQGMNISDEQINMMKNSEIMKMAHKKVNENPEAFNQIPPSTTSLTNNIEEEKKTSNPSYPQMPNMGNMDMKSMMDFMMKNPDLLKSFGPMFGGKNGEVPPQLETIMYILSIPQRIKSYLKSTKGMITISLIVILIISYFYRS